MVPVVTGFIVQSPPSAIVKTAVPLSWAWKILLAWVELLTTKAAVAGAASSVIVKPPAVSKSVLVEPILEIIFPPISIFPPAAKALMVVTVKVPEVPESARAIRVFGLAALSRIVSVPPSAI